MIRRIKIFSGIFAMLLIGAVMEKHNLNFLDNNLPFLIRRGGTHPSAYFEGAQSLQGSLATDSRWLSTAVLLLIMAALTAFILHAYFEKRYVVKVGLLFYAVLIGVAGVCGAMSLIFQGFKSGIDAAFTIKDLLEQPFALLVLFPIFYFIEKSKEQASSGTYKK